MRRARMRRASYVTWGARLAFVAIVAVLFTLVLAIAGFHWEGF